MHNRAFFLRYKLHHVLFWMLVLGCWYALRVDDYSTPEKAFTVTAVKVADLALMIYITNGLLIPHLLYRRKYFLFALVFILMVLTGSVLKMRWIGHYLDMPALYDWQHNLKKRLYDNIIPHFFLVIAGMAVKLLLDYAKLQGRLADTARQKAEAELNFLKSQINPHFLFNSINSVYFLISKDNADARAALHRFSEMLRYQLYEAGGEKVPLGREIQFLEDYIELQQLRRDGQYDIRFEHDTVGEDIFIEPLLLIPFVENAFKHVSHHPGPVNYIRVDLRARDHKLEFVVENSREEGVLTESSGGGTGIANVTRRLELLYPGKHQLEINAEGNRFIVKLEMNLR